MMNFKNQKFFGMTYYFAVIALGIALTCFSCTTQPESTVKTRLNSLTPQDRTYISNFFKVTVFKTSFGYTIFGEKPMSFETIRKVEEPENLEGIDYMAIEHIFDHLRLWEDWQVWQKHSHLFPLKGYALIQYISPLYPHDCVEVAIINEKCFIQTVNKHLADFQSVLGDSITARQVFDGYIKGEGEIFQNIRHHEGLFGTLLGYGRGNAWEYMKRSGGETMASFIDVGNVIETKDALPPLFKVVADSDETTKLRSKYSAERAWVNKAYQSEDFLEQVLDQLTGH